MKRILDVTISFLALLTLSPLLLLVALFIRLTIGSPVIFKQQRPGLEGVPFYVYKFRTMTDECDEIGILLPSEQRLTTSGKIFRALSLDELPQLWNVFVGEMSLVGPRPLLMEYLNLYNSRQSKRHKVRPGITGWAQVNGRNLLSWEQKFEYDIWYVENQSLWFDFKILLLTVKKVLKAEGVNKSGNLIMDSFKGTPESKSPIDSKGKIEPISECDKKETMHIIGK